MAIATKLYRRRDGETPDDAIGLLWKMLLAREFDAALPALMRAELTHGSTHAALGQEAVAVGACAALRPDDYITSTHRGHAHTIAKGGDPGRMMAELLGRDAGYCRGKGGSMHVADFSIGMLGANGIVGGGFGLATGAALSARMRGSGQVALCFFGDGALNKGAFYEAANIAAIWKLPVVYLCENNQFAMSARVERMTSVRELHERAVAFGFPGVTVDGMDILAVRDATVESVERARRGDGPSLVVATCYRFGGHFGADTETYRTKDEVEVWRARDPIDRYRVHLIEAGYLTEGDAEGLAEEAAAQIKQAIEYARGCPEPALESAFEDVYA